MPPADSTDVDEDDAVIEAFRRISALRSGLLLILAPRKPERFDVVARSWIAPESRFVRRSDLERGRRGAGSSGGAAARFDWRAGRAV